MITDRKQAWHAKMADCGVQEVLLFPAQLSGRHPPSQQLHLPIFDPGKPQELSITNGKYEFSEEWKTLRIETS